MKIFLMNIIPEYIYRGLITRSSVVLLLLCAIVLQPFVGMSQSSHSKINTVVIDAGHGGKDPGAISKIINEKDVVLSIALKLGTYIEKYFPNVNVIYTRKTDVFIPLNRRSEIANQNKADLFISIHANANDNHSISGTETYTLGLHKTKENLAVAMKENSVMLYEDDYSTKYEGFDPKNPASYIIFNLLQGMNRENSINLAEFTEFQFKTRVGRHSRGVREAGFWVLKQVSMPSILVEVGFVSNPTEANYLKHSENQDYLASAIFRAFRDYKTKVEESSVVLERKEELVRIDTTITTPVINEPETNSQLEYCIQIKSSTKQIPLNSAAFNQLENIKERMSDGVYKYTVGSTDKYKEIVILQKEIRKVINDCFVVVFYNGERISLSKAKKLQKT
ncbi:N-acetylmuramoyl-L-alanine amidase family protein [Labilibaculum euxinus]|uniref:N-acetylmuramoyl-L-alanine amidase n=1 Tax=Labilibaculum euxinus TaxID=2686357 RepID=A0A7M4D6N1_9BACT|nr:N-acetylmuramoyl-L-alanine amidase [Labilibaculum euxinus]MUP38310.1 N-acetylmuramoyl-L-alanine amidase [Labilibaculum euxinus]MVB07515.1 N-acetylmuramoyl-L-alanine amidase [Labilibaculum euxinus]